MPRSAINFKGLSLDRLESLSRVVRHGTISMAAQGSASLQTQFSRQIGELEDYFGVKLLERSSSPHKPTAEAEELARIAEVFMADLERLRQSAVGDRQSVVIGAGDVVIRTLLIPLAKQLIGRNIRLVFKNLTSRSIQSELKARRLDIGILHPDRVPDGIERKDLPVMGMSLIVPSGRRSSKSMKWSDLADQPVALLEGGGRSARFVRERANEAGVRLDVALECSSSSQVVDAVHRCACFGFVPDLLKKHLPPGVEVAEFDGGADFKNEYAVAWRQSERIRNAALGKVLVELLGEGE